MHPPWCLGENIWIASGMDDDTPCAWWEERVRPIHPSIPKLLGETVFYKQDDSITLFELLTDVPMIALLRWAGDKAQRCDRMRTVSREARVTYLRSHRLWE